MQNAHAVVQKTRSLLLVEAGEKGETLGVIAIAAIYLGLIVTVGLTRQYLGYGTETDYIGGFVPEAQRFLSGEPLQSEFHPPFYSIVIALAYALVGDWLRAGLLVSSLSSVTVIITSYFFFLTLFNRAAAWGAVFAFFASSVFLKFSLSATSDIFFLALFMTSCLLGLRAVLSGSLLLWMGCGIAVGLSFMTRTNALTLAALLLLPLLTRASSRAKVAAGLALLGAIAAPLLAFAVYGAATGSNLLPSQNHLNIAMTYFGPDGDRMSGDARLHVEEQFESTRDVLLHAPDAIIKTYIFDFYTLVSSGLTRLVEAPLYYMLVPGMILLFLSHRKSVLVAFAGVVAAQILLVNFKQFEPRLYLFLVPWIGAAIGESCWWLARLQWRAPARSVLALLVAAMFLAATGLATAKAYSSTRNETRELAEVVPIIRQLVDEQAVIFARKGHLGFHIGASTEWLPHLDELADLRDLLQAHPDPSPLYIFYGEHEQARRPQYAELGGPEPPEWLRVVARSAQPGGWVLLRVVPTGDNPSSTAFN